MAREKGRLSKCNKRKAETNEQVKQHWQGKMTDFLRRINARLKLMSKRHWEGKKTDFQKVINASRQKLMIKRHWQGKNKELQKGDNDSLEVRNKMVIYGTCNQPVNEGISEILTSNKRS